MRRVVLTVLALLLTAGAFYALWEQPPEQTAAVAQSRVESKPESADNRTISRKEETSVLPEGEALPGLRQNGVYTLLLAGCDDGNGNTDTLILARLDTNRHRINLVSLPRDTLINVPWEVRKINAVYGGARSQGKDGLAALKTQVARLTGFVPDGCAVVDLTLFTEAVDLLGGIWFDVPMDMDYEDPSQNLSIHLQPGYQLLNGEQAMKLCRYRSGYVTGDLGRIEMQQRFLRACAGQLLQKETFSQLPTLLELLAERMETDLSAANVAWLLRQALACKAEDLHVATAPGHPAWIAGYSYEVLNLEDWLGLLNEALNPFDTPITRESLDLVYGSEGNWASTAELLDAAYYHRNEAAPVAAEPEDAGSGGPVIVVVAP